MARNAEKAMTTLARFRAAQLAEKGKGQQETKPVLASDCHDLQKAEKWRMQVIREISRKVSQIQNAGLGEFRIRELNDEINKHLKEKGHWEARIKELGGPDYSKTFDHDGKEVPGNRGYKYFGASKDLPGVRELFEQEPPPPPRRTRAELMKNIDADYYGYRDDDDGVLIPLEKEYNDRTEAEALEKWMNRKNVDASVEKHDDDDDIYAVEEEPLSDEEEGDSGINSKDSGVQRFIAHVPVPTRQEIEEAVVKKKKEELLQQYVSEGLLEDVETTKKLKL